LITIKNDDTLTSVKNYLKEIKMPIISIEVNGKVKLLKLILHAGFPTLRGLSEM